MVERSDEARPGEESPLGRTYRDPEPEDPAVIRTDIDETRERMSETLDEIGDRLNPHHLKEQVKHNIREATIGRAETMARNAADQVRETQHTIMDTIRDNPIPAAMVGIGLGWLIWNGRKEASYDNTRIVFRGSPYLDQQVAGGAYGSAYAEEPGTIERVRERAGDIGENVRERVGELADEAREAVSDLTERTQEAVGSTTARAREMAGSLAQETRYRSHRIEDRFQQTMHETPLAVGAAAAALGLAVGLAAPTTRREAELMGGARDQLVDRVREVAQETTEKVQHVAERVMGEAQTTAEEAAREEGLSS